MAAVSPSPDAIIIHVDEHVKVRGYSESDAASLAFHGNNRKIWDNLRDRRPFPYKEADAEEWIRRCAKPEMCAASGPWTLGQGATGAVLQTHYAIVIDGEACGSIGISFGSDVYKRSAELGYWLAETHQGRGIMSRIVPLFVRWTWSTFGILVRIYSTVYDGNKASEKVLRKSGFVYEGTMVDSVIKNGTLRSELMFATLRPKVGGT